MSQKALIQIVNENDEPIGLASVEEAQNKGLIQQISRVMVEDEDGLVLLQKRAANRRLFPGRWDNSSAGHVDEGEDYIKAAFREMDEEIGLRDVRLDEVDYFYTSFTFKSLKLNQFQRIYKTEVPKGTHFDVGLDELEKVEWFTRDELRELIKEPETLTVGLRETIKRLYL